MMSEPLILIISFAVFIIPPFILYKIIKRTRTTQIDEVKKMETESRSSRSVGDWLVIIGGILISSTFLLPLLRVLWDLLVETPQTLKSSWSFVGLVLVMILVIFPIGLFFFILGLVLSSKKREVVPPSDL